MSRRGFVIAGLVVAAVGFGELVRRYFSERDPLVQLRVKEIEREVALMKHSPPSPTRAHGPDYTEVDQLEPYDNSAFETLSDDRVVDLRSWKEVPADRMFELYCPVTLTRRPGSRRSSPLRRTTRRAGPVASTCS